MRKNRRDILVKMAERYARDGSFSEPSGGASGPKMWKARLAAWIAVHAVWLAISALAAVALAFAAVWLYAFLSSVLGMSDGDWRSAGSYANGIDYRSYFPADAGNIPHGVPVESWVVGMSVDKNRYGPPDDYRLPFYRDHTGQDFSRTWKDRITWYLPYVLSTHDAVVKLTETRSTDPEDAGWWIYVKNEFRNWAYVEIRSRVKKSKADQNLLVKPYGNYVVLSSPDGTFYTLYAHLDSVRSDILGGKQAVMRRGDPVGIMGNTWNSFGAHLHYEVLDCGDNPDFNKSYRDCRRVNPFAYDQRIGDNYVGADPGRNKTVYAWTAGAKSVPISASSVASSVKSQYVPFCQWFGNVSSWCANTFSVAYQWRSEQTYPDIPAGEAVAAAEKYVAANYGYWKASLTAVALAEVAAAEGMPGSGTDAAALYAAIGKGLSHGKYHNRFRIYKKKELFSSKEKSDAEAGMLADMSSDLDAATAGGTAEKGFSEYYRSAGYRSDSENPYVYNMISADKTFMQLRDSQGKPDGTYREYGALAVYQMVK